MSGTMRAWLAVLVPMALAAGIMTAIAVVGERLVFAPPLATGVARPFDLEVALAQRESGRAASLTAGDTGGASNPPPTPGVGALDEGAFMFGVYTPASPGDRLAAVADWERSAGEVNAVMFFVDFSRDIDERHLVWVVRSGRLPLLSWEPWFAARGVDQPGFSLASIAAGDHDRHLRQAARTIRRVPGPVMVRFAHEMNGHWYPWSERVNGNRPGEFVEAWRHVHDLFAAEGVTNVWWVWSPNVTTFLPFPLVELWPGEDYVDVVGVVGYLRPGERFDERYRATIDEIRSFTELPIVVTETSVQHGPAEVSRSETVCRLVRDARADPDVVGLVWFDQRQRADWRLGLDAGGFAAGRHGECP
jgi:mannan endo-1,4-beta-mannosidase